MNPGCKWVAWSSLSRMGQKLSRRVLSRIKHSFFLSPHTKILYSHEHGVLTSMCVPHETILEIHVSDCHRYMIQHKKYGSIPKKQRDKSSTTSESFTGWWFQPSHRHYSVGTTSNISEWKPSISKATVMRQVNLQFVPDMGALKKTISTGRSSALV